MYPSIFSNVISGRDPEEAAAKTRALGLRSVQLIPAEITVGFGFDAEEHWYTADLHRWARAFHANEIEICAVGGYLNLLAVDQERRTQNIATFETYLRTMPDLGVKLITTETGSFAPTGDWDDDPANRTPEAWDEFRKILERLVGIAEQEDVTILIEPYVVNVCHTPELGARMVHEIGSTHLGLCMDPTNFFSNASATSEQVEQVVRKGFIAEEGLFGLAHAKDVTPPESGAAVPGLPGPGQGILDYPLYLDLLSQHGYGGPLVIEHLREPEVPKALRFIHDQIAAHAGRQEEIQVPGKTAGT